MRAEIDQFGCLRVMAETPLEAYALSKWCDGYEPFRASESFAPCSSTFIVHSGVNEKGERP